jgi:hypothetical protein
VAPGSRLNELRQGGFLSFSQGGVKSDDLESARFQQFKSKVRNFKSDWQLSGFRSEISDFGFEMQESCTFEIGRFHNSPAPVSVIRVIRATLTSVFSRRLSPMPVALNFAD